MVKNISIYGLVLAYLLLFVLIAVSFKEKLKLEKDVVVSFGRMSLQLFLAGFVLLWLFRVDKFYLNVVVLVGMVFFATRIVLKRANISYTGIAKYIFLSILVSSLSVLSIVVFGIVGLSYPRASYLIPLAGMIIGNSMNSTAIGIERFFSTLNNSKEMVEDLLCLGAMSEEAVDFVKQASLKASILPTLTSSSGMGVVFLPGMMTGQVLSGVNPENAVKYQIAIVIAISVAVCLTNYIMLKILSKKSINFLFDRGYIKI